MIYLKVTLAALWFIPMTVASILLAIAANLFCWLIAAFVDRDGNLPHLLRWFQTPDATCFDAMWVQEHPAWSKYKIATTWIARNPAYGFRRWAGTGAAAIAKTYGDITIADGEHGRAGWFLLITERGYWNFSYIIDLHNKSCMRGTWGWNFIPVAKGYESVNTGILETDLIRFYSFGVVGQ